jgi:hypothetical protein
VPLSPLTTTESPEDRQHGERRSARVTASNETFVEVLVLLCVHSCVNALRHQGQAARADLQSDAGTLQAAHYEVPYYPELR